MEQQINSIRVLFTDKANLALDEIIKKFNLEESYEDSIKKNREGKLSNIVVIDHLAKDFVREILSENDFKIALQKDLGVSQQISEQIAKEIIEKIIPFLEKEPESKFSNPGFAEIISEKLIKGNDIKKDEKVVSQNINPKINIPDIVLPKTAQEPIEKSLPKNKETSTTKPIVTPEEKNNFEPRSAKASDTYREPIE